METARFIGTVIGVHGRDWGMGPGMMGPGMGWYGFGFAGFLLMVLFWAALIIGIAYLIRWIVAGRAERRPGDEAMDILRKRFASGEIGKEEFEERRPSREDSPTRYTDYLLAGMCFLNH